MTVRLLMKLSYCTHYVFNHKLFILISLTIPKSSHILIIRCHIYTIFKITLVLFTLHPKVVFISSLLYIHSCIFTKITYSCLYNNLLSILIRCLFIIYLIIVALSTSIKPRIYALISLLNYS